MTNTLETDVSSTELVEAMCEAAAEYPEWANQSQMEAALSVARPIIERELLRDIRRVVMQHNADWCYGRKSEPCPLGTIMDFARERGIEL